MAQDSANPTPRQALPPGRPRPRTTGPALRRPGRPANRPLPCGPGTGPRRGAITLGNQGLFLLREGRGAPRRRSRGHASRPVPAEGLVTAFGTARRSVHCRALTAQWRIRRPAAEETAEFGEEALVRFVFDHSHDILRFSAADASHSGSSHVRLRACPASREAHDACRTPVCPSPGRSRPSRGLR